MSAADESKGSAMVLRALRMVELLASEPLRGLTNKDLAAAMRCPPSYVTRTAAALIECGWAVKDESSGRFRIGRSAARVGITTLSALDKHEQQLAEVRRNFTISQ
ncbi:helix-turn-helix domain-containing protein [Variovorax boronicumulans]|uniref:helix-turn-helix domain-containing protein n=1 Tax=Variovorax boronicumulans TaxID=436515 RepID=UPI001C592D13